MRSRAFASVLLLPFLPSLAHPQEFLGAGAKEIADAGRTRWEQITPFEVNRSPRLPLGVVGVDEGPAVLHMQILLNRALFSPGALDGRWGHNSKEAVRWFQASAGLPSTGSVDAATYERLRFAAGSPEQLTRAHKLTTEDVAGPFVRIPTDIYEHAKLACSCYETLTEKLAERFHTTHGILQILNPSVRLDRLQHGDVITVPNIRDAGRSTAQIHEIVVSGEGNFLQARDSSGRVLFHFAATLGSQIDPSPAGVLTALSVTQNPVWHYQPAILKSADKRRPPAMIPPGPNSAVGNVWIELSKQHYGIHGTKSPETIGYATSSGCVRLTNWDAQFLSRTIRPGTRVRFMATRDERRVLRTPAGGAPRPSVPSKALESVELQTGTSLVGPPQDPRLILNEIKARLMQP